jgi:heme/copper-type cytochrome/quinol oxidase subunit 2
MNPTTDDRDGFNAKLSIPAQHLFCVGRQPADPDYPGRRGFLASPGLEGNPQLFEEEGELMNRVAIRSILAMLMVFPVALAMGLLQPGAVRAQEQQKQVIELSAKKYEYSNAPLHVKVGAKILLKITATDHDHGFKLAAVPDGAESSGGGLLFTSPQDCWQLKKGETGAIEFVAQTPGTYTFKCCHTCGLGHRGMNGQIIVEQ